MSSSQHLDAITKARAAYALAKTTLEAKLRDQLKDELSNLQTQIDIAVRYAYDSKQSKASILRAMGTKDYGTLNACLDRTRAVSEIVGDDPLDSAYRYENDILTVTYIEHGPMKISGVAEFSVRVMDDKSVWLMANTPLWDEGYANRNDLVAMLDGKQDGFYYDEAVSWWKRSS